MTTKFFPIIAVIFFGVKLCPAQPDTQFRPPAVPLVTSDPYLSIWSEADKLTDDVTRHWTHHPNALVSLIRIDGTTYRLMGNDPSTMPAMDQTSLTITPTRSIYQFASSKAKVTLTFMTPLLPDDLNVLTRPVTYLTWKVQSADGQSHQVQIFDSTSSELAVNEVSQPVIWDRTKFGTLTALKAGTQAQTTFVPEGDDTRIDWGYAYAVAPSDVATSAIGNNDVLNQEFAGSGNLQDEIDPDMPRPVSQSNTVLAFSFDLGSVGSNPISRHLTIGYDEIDSINYYGHKLPPYWRQNGTTPAMLFESAEKDYGSLISKCKLFDKELTNDATKLGGEQYAQIIALAYRECLAANGIAVDSNNQPLLFTKENTSNGDIATVDVIFPMDPIFLLLSPSLAKASLEAEFAYAASPHWKFPNAPHDLGTYPDVFGRDDGGEGMPVEESGNMILIVDGIAHAEGSPHYANRWWPELTKWAQYLVQYGLDPEDQLCTDDFMGHLAHNANLSVKAILALGAYGDLCKMRGDLAGADKYHKLAVADANHWMQVADAGDHSLLAFDKPNSWSQKYNLVWDQILNLNIFPPEVREKEIAFYKSQLQPYGLPLDSRTKLTKTDWSTWSATMSSSKVDFKNFINPIFRYLNETTSRDPIADSYITNDINSSGMHARPVVGGLFIKMLSDPAIWHKWASRDTAKVGNWAPIPKPPVITEVVPTSLHAPQIWQYTIDQPDSDWVQPSFNDVLWAQGPGGFGTQGTPNAVIGTNWDSDDIWLRRKFTMPKTDLSQLKLYVYHDEDVEVYFNGVLALSVPSYQNQYLTFDIKPEAKKLLKPGAKITIAVHCHQTTGGQGVDVGLCTVTSPN